MRKNFSYLFKIAVTAGLIWYFLGKINIRDSLAAAKEANLPIFFGALLLTAASWFLSALRWRKILSFADIVVSPFKLFLYNLIGNFYGIVLPGGKVSGDVMCAYRFTKDAGEDGNGRKYFLSVFADRFLGMLTMSLFLSVYFIFGHPIIQIFGGYTTVIALLVVGGSIIGLVLMFSGTFDFILEQLGRLPVKAWSNLCRSFLSAFQAVRKKTKAVAAAFSLSVISVLLNLLSIQTLANSIELETDFLVIGFAFLSATLLISIPVTLAGIGLREGGMVFVLVQSGAELSQSAALSILALTILLIYSAIGGLWELYFHFLKRVNVSVPA